MISTDFIITRTRRVWEFPKWRFVIWEPKDEEWCRRLGFGREVEVIEEVKLSGFTIVKIEHKPLDSSYLKGRMETAVELRKLS